jgi:hypothetical protein
MVWYPLFSRIDGPSWRGLTPSESRALRVPVREDHNPTPLSRFPTLPR